MTSIAFWNRPSTREINRSADPLGFDALREAMADGLVPLLTGGTRDADEYLWTLIGLRWARQETGAVVDKVLFNRGFAIFERALKQYWYRFEKRSSSGITVIKLICEQSAPDVQRRILLDQRATGLLGNYIVSLRGMGLVQKDSLRLVDEASELLLGDIAFAPRRGWDSSWASLSQAFKSVSLKLAKKRLGNRLFQGAVHEMNQAARAFRAKPSATNWFKMSRRALGADQARLAAATRPVAFLESKALEAFGLLLRGHEKLPGLMKRQVQSLAVEVRDANPFPPSWDTSSRLRGAMSGALSALAKGQSIERTLLQLHLEVTQEVRHTDPWLRCLGESPAAFQDWKPGAGIPDYRFGNLRRLVRQTNWGPRAS